MYTDFDRLMGIEHCLMLCLPEAPPRTAGPGRHTRIWLTHIRFRRSQARRCDSAIAVMARRCRRSIAAMGGEARAVVHPARRVRRAGGPDMVEA